MSIFLKFSEYMNNVLYAIDDNICILRLPDLCIINSYCDSITSAVWIYNTSYNEMTSMKLLKTSYLRGGNHQNMLMNVRYYSSNLLTIRYSYSNGIGIIRGTRVRGRL